MSIFKRFLLLGVGLACIMLTRMESTQANPIAIGVGAGADFPFSHRDTSDPGFSFDGIFRMDPYEIRFHFAEIEAKIYSVSIAYKFFFNDELFRFYLEPAVGPLIFDTPGAAKGVAYGVRPEGTLGVDIGINTHLSAGVVTRYFTMLYFGDTPSGKTEANHGLSLLANLIYWF